MSEQLSGDQLVKGDNYFLVGYLDQKLRVPLIRSLIYLRRDHLDVDAGEGLVPHHVFANAVAWFKAADPHEIAYEEMVWIAENELDCIKSVQGLIDELREQCLAR